MNREQKRNFIKIAKKKGISEEHAKAYMAMKEEQMANIIKAEDVIFERRIINDGDKVRIDVDKISSSKYYSNMMDEYKEFIENSRDIVFTAKVEKGHFVSLEENPKWLFWVGDLIG